MSLIIRKVSKAIVEFLRQDYMKLPQTVAEMENLTQTLLEHHRFPQCIRALDGTHIPIHKLNQNYADNISRRGFTSLNIEVLGDYRYCFSDVMVKWQGIVHNS